MSRSLNGRGTLVFATDHKHVLMVFEVTGVDRLMAIYPSREAALRALARSDDTPTNRHLAAQPQAAA